MRNILSIIIICCLATMSAHADMTQYNKSFGQTDYDEMTSDRAVMNSTRYSSPIYEPFTNSVPSDQTEVGAEQSSSHKGHIRRGFINPSDPGDPSNDSPIGDAVLPLLALALAFAGVIALRRRRIR